MECQWTRKPFLKIQVGESAVEMWVLSVEKPALALVEVERREKGTAESHMQISGGGEVEAEQWELA